MEISNNGIEFIKNNEGCKLTAYQDVVGVWTIGVGHTKGVYKGMVITQAQADAYLREDIKSHQVFKTFFKRTFNQNQFDALCSFEFNLGGGIWKNDGWNPTWNDTQIVNMMNKYHTPKAIIARRDREVALYKKQVTNNDTSNSSKIKVYQNGDFVRFSGVYLSREEAHNAKTTGFITTLRSHEGYITLRYIDKSGFGVYAVSTDGNQKNIIGWINTGCIY